MKRNKLSVTLVSSLLFLSIINIKAQLWTQFGSPINGASQSERSGTSISLSDDGFTIGIGSPYYSVNGNILGKVLIFEYSQSDWYQKGNSIIGQQINEYLGRTICLNSNGSIIAISAPDNNEKFENAGQIRIYEYINSSWIQVGNDINGEEKSESIGMSLSLSSDGQILAYRGHCNNENRFGFVRIMKYNGNDWVQLGNKIYGGEVGEEYGTSVCLNSEGSIVAFGIPGHDTGYVQLYKFINDEWIQIGQDIYGENYGDYFGSSVSMNSEGSVVAIGAYGNYGSGPYSGHARVYKYNDSIWSQYGSDINGEMEQDHSYQVSLNSDGSILALAAIYNDGNGYDAGQVRIFQYSGNDWAQLGNDIEGEKEHDSFGHSLSINAEGTILAASSIEHNNITIDEGQVRIFRNSEFISGSEQAADDNIRIYPNPTNGILFIERHNEFLYHKIEVINFMGEVIKNFSASNKITNIDLGGFSRGIYFLRFFNSNGSSTYKILFK